MKLPRQSCSRMTILVSKYSLQFTMTDKLTVCSVQLCNVYNTIPRNSMFKYFIIVLPKSKGNTIIHLI